MIFFITLIMGTMISISSYSWFGMWMGLEINLLSIIPLMNNSMSMSQSEASLKYFLVQALASTILMFSLILMSKFQMFLIIKYNNSLMIMFNSALLMKMGAAPFHFWFPEIMEGLSWMNCLIMLTWQKIAPMMLLIMKNTMFFMTIIMFSMLISGIMGLNQISMRKILAFSSINHIGWMLTSILFMKSIWLLYFIVYSIISINMITMFNKFNIFNMNQLFNLLNKNKILKFCFMLNFLSLSGLPPFLGFVPKWMTIQLAINNQMYLFTLIIVIMTLFTMFYYIRLMLNTLLMNSNSIKNLNFISKNMFSIFFFNFISLTSLILITISFNLN
uniref:NADH-ubiquinone oxidoreductase chain 2 n=1 Tax=Agathidium nigripenne TaxID=1586957 RepID=A0A343C4A2_9COLE|nr:NADH dehydrogenase subunit 2 [Agathidium nigripenne]